MKLNFRKFIVIPVIIAVIASLLVALSQALAGNDMFISETAFSWIAFQSWAVYFLAGCDVKGGIRAFIGYFMGITASIAIIYFSNWLNLGFWSTPLAILILVIPVICLERVPWFDLVPALFIGSGAYFAMATFIPETTASFAGFIKAGYTLLFFCFLGLLCGWITIKLRCAWEKCATKNQA